MRIIISITTAALLAACAGGPELEDACYDWGFDVCLAHGQDVDVLETPEGCVAAYNEGFCDCEMELFEAEVCEGI